MRKAERGAAPMPAPKRLTSGGGRHARDHPTCEVLGHLRDAGTKSRADQMTAYDDALRLMNDAVPNTVEVRHLLDAAISDGDDRAEYALATWYLHGKHVKKNVTKGIELLERAATKGNADASFDLAVCYERGQGVAKSDAEAFRLYRDAAKRGDPEAMQEVGRMLYYGLGVAEDRQAADRWLAKAERRVKDHEKLSV